MGLLHDNATSHVISKNPWHTVNIYKHLFTHLFIHGKNKPSTKSPSKGPPTIPNILNII